MNVTYTDQSDMELDTLLLCAKRGSDLESVEVYENRVEIIMRHASDVMLLSYPPQPCPDTLTKYTWIPRNGKMVLDSTQKGVVNTKPIKEEFIFN